MMIILNVVCADILFHLLTVIIVIMDFMTIKKLQSPATVNGTEKLVHNAEFLF